MTFGTPCIAHSFPCQLLPTKERRRADGLLSRAARAERNAAGASLHTAAIGAQIVSAWSLIVVTTLWP